MVHPDRPRRLLARRVGVAVSDRVFVLSHAMARDRALMCISTAPDGYFVRVGPPKRDLAINALLHAEITEVSDVKPWDGQLRDVEFWKRLFVAAWLRATGESVQIATALDGHGVDLIYAKTSEMSQAQVSELVSFIQAWKAEQGIGA